MIIEYQCTVNDVFILFWFFFIYTKKNTSLFLKHFCTIASAFLFIYIICYVLHFFFKLYLMYTHMYIFKYIYELGRVSFDIYIRIYM